MSFATLATLHSRLSRLEHAHDSDQMHGSGLSGLLMQAQRFSVEAFGPEDLDTAPPARGLSRLLWEARREPRPRPRGEDLPGAQQEDRP